MIYVSNPKFDIDFFAHLKWALRCVLCCCTFLIGHYTYTPQERYALLPYIYRGGGAM